MTSTGNDIVALKAINIARSQQPQFYSKVLSKDEKDLYAQNLRDAIPFENFLWLSWSVKESVFKFLQRHTPNLIFSPTKIKITQLELPLSTVLLNDEQQIEKCNFIGETFCKGVVSFKNQPLYFRSLITDEFICSVVNDTGDFVNTCWGIQMIGSDKQTDQSKAVRAFLSKRLKSLFPDDNLQIEKSSHGYPVLLKDGGEIPISVSLAHHGYFVAYSIQIN